MNKMNDRWSALSMKDRADLIKLYVESGITDLREIKKDYNSFKDGGSTENISFVEKIVDKINDSEWGNNKLKDIAYSIGVRAKESGKATLGNVITGTVVGLLGINNKQDDNLRAFIYGPEAAGFKKSDDNTFNYNYYIQENYPDRDINKYEGYINNFGNYIIDSSKKSYIESLIKSGKPIYVDADNEYVKDFIKGKGGIGDFVDIYEPEYYPENEGRDDVKNYRLVFRKDSKGNIVADATDLYDFEEESYSEKYSRNKGTQARLLNKVGNPYILSQSNIPVTFVDVEELESKDWMSLSEEQKKALQRAKTFNFNIENLK